MEKQLVSYREFRNIVQNGDVLLFRARGVFAWAVRTFGRSKHSHAAGVVIAGDYVLCVDTTKKCGGKGVLLENVVKRLSGNIDVYRYYCGHCSKCISDETGNEIYTGKFSHLPDVVSRKIADILMSYTDRRYGWRSVVKAAWSHLPVVRWLVKPNLDDSTVPGCFPDCSQMIATAYHLSGIDLVPNLSDIITEPGDLSRSGLLGYVCTLVKDE